MEKNGVWYTSFHIPAYMVGTDRKAGLVAICNLLQEVAGTHAQAYDLGYDDMQTKGQFWVLNRLRVKVEDFPGWNSTVEVRTWVNSMKGPFSYRNFSMYDEQGTLLISACSLWALLDSATRRPVRILQYSLPVLENAVSLCGQPDKLKALEEGTLIGGRKVRRGDLDMIGHVNNARYIEWLMDAMDENKMPSKIMDVNYLQESFLDDDVGVFSEEQSFAIRKGETDLCRIQFL